MSRVTFRPYDQAGDSWLMWKTYDDYDFPDSIPWPKGSEQRHQQIASFIRERVGPEWRYEVMQIDGEVAGLIGLILSDGVHPTRGKECRVAEVMGIDVLAPWRKKGHGKDLLRHAIREATAAGCDILVAWPHKDNTASRATFSSLGFAAYPQDEDEHGRVYYELWLTA